MRTIKLTVLLGTAVALSVSCGMLGAKKVFPSEDDLRREYKESSDKFKAKYDGKEVSASGRAGIMSITDSGGMVYFESNTDSSVSGTPSITCYVDSPDSARFKELKVEPGTLIRVKGKMKLDAGTMRLENCKLEKVGSSALSDE
ncbi:MAG TPA: hypothetical protein VFR80_08160 [Pyrinomonadaceae bacterium]|nr:hypothetical protein [Pyrinomonadaceae bacterium]